MALLGATGSIGSQTLEVLRREEEHFEVVAIAGARQLEALAAIAKEFHVSRIGVADESDRDILAGMVSSDVDIVVGERGLSELAQCADIIVNAVVGFV